MHRPASCANHFPTYCLLPMFWPKQVSTVFPFGMFGTCTLSCCRKSEAKNRAVVLEMIGDLPEADSKPPSNMLFIAKLNQVTTEEDLETIFGRFGNITSCDIIRDKKTGDSLCYAFLGYDTDEACENAYFKMNNVLIDDRRIKVTVPAPALPLQNAKWISIQLAAAADAQTCIL